MGGRIGRYVEWWRFYVATGRDRWDRPFVEFGIGHRVANVLVSGPLSVMFTFDRLLPISSRAWASFGSHYGQSVRTAPARREHEAPPVAPDEHTTADADAAGVDVLEVAPGVQTELLDHRMLRGSVSRETWGVATPRTPRYDERTRRAVNRKIHGVRPGLR